MIDRNLDFLVNNAGTMYKFLSLNVTIEDTNKCIS